MYKSYGSTLNQVKRKTNYRTKKETTVIINTSYIYIERRVVS